MYADRMLKGFLVLVLLTVQGVGAADIWPIRPYETDTTVPGNTIDELVGQVLVEKQIQSAALCSDEVFVRRAYLDITGTLPEAREVSVFLENTAENKRAELIDALLESDAFNAYWSMKWCDLLRVKAEFPINLWPNAVQAYHRWIYDTIRDNLPYDRFSRELLTASGSNFRVPPVNFYRAIQGKEPSSIASAVALTFMGARLENWPEEKRAGMEAFFSRIAYKPTAEWKEEIVCLDPAAEGDVTAVFPDGVEVRIAAGEDPRKVFADWLITPENPWFARNIVNRIWYWLMGRGIIQEPDDIRENNPPVNPALLAYLEKELIESGFDLRHIYRLILNSHTWQQSPVPCTENPEGEALFAYYPVRRLDAEVLIDALNSITGSTESYSSPIPEPFTFIPEEQPAVLLADGSITSSFLEIFGRPSRDTGLESERNNEVTDAQRLHMLNSSHVQQKLEKSWRIQRLLRAAKGQRRFIVKTLYLTILSRYPQEDEINTALAYMNTQSPGMKQAVCDLAWALINTKEFLYRH